MSLHNLPVELSSFIGRTQELGELEKILRTTRLLTLTGIGGAGKTRLALKLATAVAPDYPEGVFWWLSARCSTRACCRRRSRRCWTSASDRVNPWTTHCVGICETARRSC